MKRNALLVLILAVFSIISGYLLSSISFVGRAGISLFYTQYQFLKSWWKGALLVFIVWIILLALQTLINKRVTKATSNFIQFAFLIIAVVGLYISYSDFRNSIAHRWLGERFHLGVYLFWLGWMAISVFVLAKSKPVTDNRVNSL